MDLTGHPLLVGFGGHGRDEAQAGLGGGEDPDRARSSSQFPVDAFEAFGGAQTDAMGLGEIEHGQPFWDGFLGPWSARGMLHAPGPRSRCQESLGLPAIGGVEDRAQRAGDALTGLPAGDEVRGVSLRMGPAAPPGQRRQHRPAGGFESGMIVGDDGLRPPSNRG